MDNFAAARNFSFSMVQSDYGMWRAYFLLKIQGAAAELERLNYFYIPVLARWGAAWYDKKTKKE